MTSIVRPLGDRDRYAAVEQVSRLLTEAREANREKTTTQDTEWVVDLASRRVVRRTIPDRG